MISSMYFSARVLVLLSIVISCSVCISSEVGDVNLKKLATANNEFAIKLHRKLASNSSQNLFFSPLSIFFALGMLYNGARGETAQEIRHFLGYDKLQLSDEDVDTSSKQLLNEVFESPKNYTLNTANAILVDKRLELVPEYKAEMQNSYNAEIRDVDFLKDTAKAVEWINNWVNSKTSGKIPRLIDDLSSDTVIALLNAIYFKGSWKKPFDVQRTTPDLFYNYGSESLAKMVPTMHISSRIPYASASGWQIVELPYSDDSISMLILLPDRRDGLAALKNDSILEEIIAARNKLRSTTVQLSLPKFKVESSIDLEEPLELLGLKRIFRGADFTGMVKSVGVRVSKAVHKAVVEVTEEGSEAAAATGFFGVAMSAVVSEPRVFKADHPFIFEIMDRKNSLILFSGQVNAL